MMNSADILGNRGVSMEEMLFEREQRVQKQRQCIEVWDTPIVCLTLNIAGPYKNFPLVGHAFREGRRLAETQFAQLKVAFELFYSSSGKCGPCAIYSVTGDLWAIKRALCMIEDETELGRLLDLDLLDETGVKLSRETLGLPPRSCLLCERQAAACARSRSHPVEELQRETIRRLQAYFFDRYANALSASAAKAMLYEVSVTPKPGLVDRTSNGAHSDMNFFTFVDSTCALTPCFRKFCLIGCENAALPDEQLFQMARRYGLNAERAMYTATDGVNTQKGLIFSIGLLCVAAGRLYAKKLCFSEKCGRSSTAQEILDEGARIAQSTLTELEQLEGKPLSNGGQVYQTYHAKGVRQEAAAGFPSVRDLVLPALRKGWNLESCGKQALLKLFACVEDTNVLHRGGSAALSTLSKAASEVLAAPKEAFEEKLCALDADLTKQGISPGGCADLLAIGYFLFFLECMGL